MALQFGPRLKALLDEPLPIIVGTTRRDGSVQMVPVWYEYRDGQIWLNGGPNRAWFKHMQRDPRVSLLVLDPKNMFRWAQIQGRLASHTLEGGDDHIEHLARRYTGGAYRGPKIERMIIRIDPERVTGGENMQPWDVTG
ncbi:MAG: PPOX class F420-dependent oxidoreductase [Chloroflexi bacterium]|nr:MAG: PPOX class F420-dependent oxidoreductase [Chloroflexota bacterium]